VARKITNKATITVAELDAAFRRAAGFEDMPAGWTPAGGWLRVSSGAQDEESQAPDIISYAIAQKLWVAKWYIVHGKSAFKGAQDEDWQRVVTDASFAKIRVAVLWKVDRLDRQNILHAIPMANALLETGADMRFATQPYITLDTMPGRMAFANMCEIAHEDSKTKSDRVIAKQAQIRSNNALTGRPPFGYTTGGDKLNKALIPLEAGRKYVPLVFQMIADGWSTIAVAEWLDTERVDPVQGEHWSPKSVSNMIRNQTYIGNRQSRVTGEIVYDGITPLVDESLWLRANKRLDNAPRGRRGPRNGKPALCTGALECGHEGAPMYRLIVQSRHKNGKVYEYYRCNGIVPNPKGCGTMVTIGELDAMVDKQMRASQGHVYRPEFVPGDEPAIKLDIDKIMVELRNLSTKGLSWDAEDATRAMLRAKLVDLQEQLKDAKPDRWVNVLVLKDDGEPLTEADEWRGADFDARRRILKNHRLTFRWGWDGGKRSPELVIAPRWAATASEVAG